MNTLKLSCSPVEVGKDKQYLRHEVLMSKKTLNNRIKKNPF